MEQGVALRHKLFAAYPNLGSMTNRDTWNEIIEALEDDLDTPRALQVWGEGVTRLSKGDADKLNQIFGLTYVPMADNPEAQALADQREKARASGDFLTADNRKAELTQLGYELLDSAEATTYIPR